MTPPPSGAIRRGRVHRRRMDEGRSNAGIAAAESWGTMAFMLITMM
jgi:hypothetical protein